MAFLEGHDRFAGRSSLRTWLSAILVNVVRARSRKERHVLSSSTVRYEDRSHENHAARGANHRRDDREDSGSWSAYPCARPNPEVATIHSELRATLAKHVKTLPAAQREVLVLRDIEGLSGAEVCAVLSLRPNHQRVLLHRARTALRTALEKED